VYETAVAPSGARAESVYTLTTYTPSSQTPSAHFFTFVKMYRILN